MPDDSSDKPLLYPRITPEYLESIITHEEYFHSRHARTTVIVVMLDMDYAVTETVHCGDSRQYDEKEGRIRVKKKLLAKLQDSEYYAMRRFLKMHKSEGTE